MPGTINYNELLQELGSSEFRELRPAQSATLSAYSASFTKERDIAVELPTGAGKSLIALLIAEAWRRDGKKVAVLTANKTLARQMSKMAASLKSPAVMMEGSGPLIPSADKRAYHRAVATAIMNYWVYFNQNPVLDPADLLIMDDAHLAEHCLHSLLSVEIDAHEHKSLFESLVTELAARFPEYSVLQDALDGNAPGTASTELLSFLDQSSIAARLKEIVDASPILATHSDLRFRWRRMRDRLEEANLYVSHHSLWFRPYAYPLIVNPSYTAVEQCLYMSATVGECSDLSRRLGARPLKKILIPEEHATGTYGRRMLVMNKIEDQDIPLRLSKAIFAALSVHPKSLWLCESKDDAERFRRIVGEWLNQNGLVGHPTWLLTSLGDEIDLFKQAPSGHLFVGGRFDGMDFKANECRLVVLATLPRAINSQEEFFTAYLRDSGFMLRRMNQRIVQALGRCNRDPEDFGVYVLADRRFATHFGRESNRLGLPRNIIAEIDSAEDATDVEVDQLAARVTSFLQQDFSAFDKDLEIHQKEVPSVAPPPDGASDTSEHEVLGWTELFEHQNFPAAQKHFKDCVEKARTGARELNAFFVWSLAKATFLYGKQGNAVARSEAPDLLETAIERGGRSSWFNRLRSSLNRHRTATGNRTILENPEYGHVVIHKFDDMLERLGAKGNRFQKWLERVTGMLKSERHAEYQEGLENLGTLLGFSASRPKYDASTDCRWRGIFSKVREVATWEVKVEHEAGGKITPTYVGQAHNQLQRASREYSRLGYTIRGTIVTHLSEFDSSAKSSLGDIRVIHRDVVFKLWEHTSSLLSRYRSDWSLEDVEVRLNAAESFLPKFPKEGWLTRALSTDQLFVPEEVLLGEWKSADSTP